MKSTGYYDAFKKLAEDIKATSDREEYFDLLKQHQKKLIQLLRMYHENTELNIKSWRFKDVAVEYTKFTWISNYDAPTIGFKWPLFSCWEMETVLKLEKPVASLILENKGVNILTPKQQLLPIVEVNKPLVQDWTLPL
jgi:hypothetical protein